MLRAYHFRRMVREAGVAGGSWPEFVETLFYVGLRGWVGASVWVDLVSVVGGGGGVRWIRRSISCFSPLLVGITLLREALDSPKSFGANVFDRDPAHFRDACI